MITDDTRKRIVNDAAKEYPNEGRGDTWSASNRTAYIDGALHERELADSELAAKDKEIEKLQYWNENQTKFVKKANELVQHYKALAEAAEKVINREDPDYDRANYDDVVAINNLIWNNWEQLKSKKV